MFLAFLDRILVPVLVRAKPGAVAVMDNLRPHNAPAVRERREAAGFELLLLPRCSPDLNPLGRGWGPVRAFPRGPCRRGNEPMWSKAKGSLRAAARTVEALEAALADVLARVASAATASCSRRPKARPALAGTAVSGERHHRRRIRTVMIIEGAIGLIVALNVLAVFSNDEVAIRPTGGVPFELALRGHTVDAVAAGVRDELRASVLESGGVHPTLPSGIVDENLAEVIAKMLGVHAPITELRILFGRLAYELETGVVKIDDQIVLKAVLFTLPDGPVHETVQVANTSDLNETVKTVAKIIMRDLDPLTLAKYEFNHAQISGDYESTLEEIEICRRHYSAGLHLLIDNLEGMVRLSQGDVAAAEGLFRRVLRRDAGLVEAKLNLAVALAARGDVAAADTLLLEAATDRRFSLWSKDHPIRAAALALRGLIAASAGAADGAGEHLRGAVGADPNLAEARELMAFVLRDQGLVTLARHHERQAAALRKRMPSKLPRVLLNVNILRQLLSRPEMARADAMPSRASPGAQS